jgi:hypothetical protein
MEKQKTLVISAEEKWKSDGMDHKIRFEMLAALGAPQCYAKESWKKLPHILKINLQSRTWTIPAPEKN